MKGRVIFVLAFAIYFVSIFGGFVQDDVRVVSGDPEMGKVSALVSTLIRPYYYLDGNESSVYRPVTSFSFYLNALISGKGAWGFRLGNVLIYAWVCWLVYRVMEELENSKTRKLKKEKINGMRSLVPSSGYLWNYARDDDSVVWWRDWAFWGTVLFIVLPIHADVVNNIVGRAEMLSLAFMLLATLKGMERKWEVCVMYLFLSMLSKETAMVGVPILLYLIWMANQVEKKEKVGASVFVMMSLVGFFLLRTVVLGGTGIENRATTVENPLKFVTTEKRIQNAVGLIPFGVGKIVFPINLSYDYSYNQIKLVDSWFDWRVILGVGMATINVLLLTGLPHQVSGGHGGPPLHTMAGIMGMMLFWGPILITGNILFPIGTIFGERLWFWPSLGVVMILFSFTLRFSGQARGPAPTRRLLEGLIIVLVIILYAGRTVVRNFDWLSQERLFLHDAKYVTGSVMAQSNAAAIYLIGRDLEKAKPVMERASEIYPKYPELLNNWGLYYQWIGKKEEAKMKFEECLVERPGSELCMGNLELLK